MPSTVRRSPPTRWSTHTTPISLGATHHTAGGKGGKTGDSATTARNATKGTNATKGKKKKANDTAQWVPAKKSTKQDDWRQFFRQHDDARPLKGPEPDFSEEGWAKRSKK